MEMYIFHAKSQKKCNLQNLLVCIEFPHAFFQCPSLSPLLWFLQLHMRVCEDMSPHALVHACNLYVDMPLTSEEEMVSM